jgi:hypothetical protein
MKSTLKHQYEQKLFIVGLSELLQSENLPSSVSPLLPGLINEVIDMIFAL